MKTRARFIIGIILYLCLLGILIMIIDQVTANKILTSLILVLGILVPNIYLHIIHKVTSKKIIKYFEIKDYSKIDTLFKKRNVEYFPELHGYYLTLSILFLSIKEYEKFDEYISKIRNNKLSSLVIYWKLNRYYLAGEANYFEEQYDKFINFETKSKLYNRLLVRVKELKTNDINYNEILNAIKLDPNARKVYELIVEKLNSKNFDS